MMDRTQSVFEKKKKTRERPNEALKISQTKPESSRRTGKKRARTKRSFPLITVENRHERHKYEARRYSLSNLSRSRTRNERMLAYLVWLWSKCLTAAEIVRGLSRERDFIGYNNIITVVVSSVHDDGYIPVVLLDFGKVLPCQSESESLKNW